MSWAALTSGGKDSILAVQKAFDAGLDVRYLVTVRPENTDSYMFHSSNLDAVRVIADIAGLEYLEIPSHGRKEEELSDLEAGLSVLSVEGVVVGAVESVYQKSRVEEIARRLGIEVFSPLWHMDPLILVREVASRLDAMIVVCAADGLDESFLGCHFDDHLIRRLRQVSARRSIHLAGEGGEYETLVLDAPFFSRPLTYSSKTVHRSPDRVELVCGGFA
jgi:diphthine-ammonia ligase